jgi:hypothetical protein
MLPEGFYRAKARSYTWETTQKGGEVIVLDFEIVDGPATGERIKWQGYFSDKTQERTIESLIYCGWKTGDLADMSGFDSQTVSLQIKHEAGYKRPDEMFARVAYVNRDRGPRVDRALSPDRVNAFAERMKGLALKVQQKIENAQAAESV